MEEDLTKSDYTSKILGDIAQKAMQKAMQEANIPICWLCDKAIQGQTPVLYQDKDRIAHTICIPCTWTALDFYLMERTKRLDYAK